MMVPETQSGRVHQELVSRGYQSLPLYTYAPFDMGRASGGFVCTAFLETSNQVFNIVGEPAPSHKLAKSSAAVALLEAVQAVEPPVQVPARTSADPDFLSPSPIVMFTPGQAKAAKALVRDVGVEYAAAAIAYYQKCSTTPGSVRPGPSTPLSVEVPDNEPCGESAEPPTPPPLPSRAPQYREDVSRALASLLRHQALNKGIPMDSVGLVKVVHLMRHLPKGTTFDDVMDVAYRSRHHHGKPRFEIYPDYEREPTVHGTRIRATDKHSITSDDVRDFHSQPEPVDAIGLPLRRTYTCDPNRDWMK